MTVASSPRAADVESQPILDGRAPPSHAAAFDADEGAWQPAKPPSLWRRWMDDPLVRSAAVNLALILTW